MREKRARARAGSGEVGGEGGEKRESDLNAVGPETIETGSTGQTGLAQADRKVFGLVTCRVV